MKSLPFSRLWNTLARDFMQSLGMLKTKRLEKVSTNLASRLNMFCIRLRASSLCDRSILVSSV